MAILLSRLDTHEGGSYSMQDYPIIDILPKLNTFGLGLVKTTRFTTVTTSAKQFCFGLIDFFKFTLC